MKEAYDLLLEEAGKLTTYVLDGMGVRNSRVIFGDSYLSALQTASGYAKAAEMLATKAAEKSRVYARQSEWYKLANEAVQLQVELRRYRLELERRMREDGDNTSS